MNALVLTLFLLFPPVAVQQPAGNEPVWLWMPTETVEQRRDREIARKEWASRKRTLEAMAASVARKQRINARYQMQPQVSQRSYYYRVRPVNVHTPTGTVTYWVPY